jgi:hypothetical protein
MVVPSGFTARYFLRTEILPTLKQYDIRIVIVTPNADEDYFREEFECEKVFVEPFELEKVRSYRFRIQGLTKMIRSFVGKKGADVTCLDTRLGIYLSQSGYSKVKKSLIKGMIYALRDSILLRKLWIFLEYRCINGNFHEHLFKKYRPVLLITSSLGNMWYDSLIMHEAKQHGVKVLSVILSWDNPSTKGMGGAKANYVLVWTEKMKEELSAYFDVNSEKIHVGGIAHFDIYRQNQDIFDKERIFKRFGLNPDRKLILVGTKSPTSYPYNPDVVEILAEAIKKEKFAVPCQILVRLHPNHFRSKGDLSKFHREMERYRGLQERYGHIYLDVPEVVSNKLPMDMPREEIIKLASILRNTDVLVTMFSTLMLEASLCNVPVVNAGMFAHNVNLDIRDATAASFPHISRVLATGGVRTCFTPEEMIRDINRYLIDPTLDKEGRERIVQNECYPNIDHAGVYIGHYIARLLRKKNNEDRLGRGAA